MKKNTICLGIIFLLCSACSNYLDIKPNGRTIPKTAEEFSALIHAQLKTVDGGEDDVLIGNAAQLLTWDSGCSDDFETCLSNISYANPYVYIGNLLGNISDNMYSKLYSIIGTCNIVLNEMEESGTEEADKVRATAYAIRGVCYYQLMRMYCEAPRLGDFNNQLGLPLVSVFDMDEKPDRSSLNATISHIESDFEKAESYHLTDDIYRFTEDVVKGYQARLYFWTGQWNKALPIAQELLGKYPLIEGDAYKAMMTNAFALSGNQLIKSNRELSITGSGDFSSKVTNLKLVPVSQRFTSTFTTAEKTTDVRYNLWVNKKRQAQKTFFNGMRGAEFKLIEAECYYHLGETDNALKSINELRAHRIENYTNLTMNNLPAISDKEIIKADAEGNSINPLIALILQERRKEMFLEGDRIFELKRNGSPAFWTMSNGLKYETKSYMYTFPIPVHDLLLNEGLVQNPGYVDIID